MYRIPRGSRRRKGASIVEFAILLPPLLLLLLGVWEVGRIVETAQVLSNAAREGARQASTGVKSQTQVETAVRKYIELAGFDSTGHTVLIRNLTQNPSAAPSDPSDDPLLANQMDMIEVTVTLPTSNVRWATPRITSIDTLTSSAKWCVMKDVPLTIDLALPVD